MFSTNHRRLKYLYNYNMDKKRSIMRKRRKTQKVQKKRVSFKNMSKKRSSPQKGGRKNRRKTKRVTFKRISNKRISKKRSRRRSSIQKGGQ